MPHDKCCLDCGQGLRVRRARRGLCPRCYDRRVRRGEALPPKLRHTFEEYLAMVVPDENGCWPWPGYVHRANRYGRSGVKQAHVRSYEHHVASVPDGFDVGHACHDQDPTCLDWRRCTHRRCVNPAHLRLQTRSANLLSRPRRPFTYCKRGHELTPENVHADRNTGYRNCVTCKNLTRSEWRKRKRAEAPPGAIRPRNKLSTEEATEVLELLREGHQQRTIAIRFGVSRTTISDIATGRSWSQVPGVRPGPRRLAQDKLEEVRRLLAEGHSQRRVAALTGVGQTTVSRIKRGG